MNARPLPVLRVLAESSRNRVKFNVLYRGVEVRFVHDERVKTFLPQMASPLFPKIDSTCVTAMRFLEEKGETVFMLGYYHKVNVLCEVPYYVKLAAAN